MIQLDELRYQHDQRLTPFSGAQTQSFPSTDDTTKIRKLKIKMRIVPRKALLVELFATPLLTTVVVVPAPLPQRCSHGINPGNHRAIRWHDLDCVGLSVQPAPPHLASRVTWGSMRVGGMIYQKETLSGT